MESTLLPGSKKPTTEKERRSRRINLLLQMSPEPFFGLAALDLCGNQQPGLLGEPGEGSLGGSWATTWAKNKNFIILVNLQLSLLQPENSALEVDGENEPPANTGMILPVLVLAECPAVPGINFH